LFILITIIASDSEGAYPVQFVDVTSDAGISFRHVSGATGKRYLIETMGPGVAFLDYDGDGYLDIYFVNGQYLPPDTRRDATNRLYRNRGDGTFVDVTEQAGVGDTGYGMGVAVGDYDNDGDLDIYVTNYGPNVLYRNEGNGTFRDMTVSAGVGDARWGVGCAFLDYDNDGDLDLYVANYLDFSLTRLPGMLIPYGVRTSDQGRMKGTTFYPSPKGFNGEPDVLYRNNGAGAGWIFTDVTKEVGIFDPSGKGMGVVCGDYDNDGDTDIFVANDLTPNFLYQNSGQRFTDAALIAGVGYSANGYLQSNMGAAFGDYDNDGDMDLVVSNYQGESCSVYRNEGNGLFSEEGMAVGIGAVTIPYVGWGVGFIDHNNDGYQDVFIANGHVLDNAAVFDPATSYAQRNLLFRNDGPGRGGRYTFTDVSAVAGPGLAIAKPNRGAAFGDYDNDGDMDILIASCNDSPTLLRNDGGNRMGHWLRVGLEGVQSNRSGIGARIRVVAGDLVQVGEVTSGTGLYSQNDLRLFFGLGDRRHVDRVEVRWPSGVHDVLTDIPADQTITIREGTR
jgi:hypothetical protein